MGSVSLAISNAAKEAGAHIITGAEVHKCQFLFGLCGRLMH